MTYTKEQMIEAWLAGADAALIRYPKWSDVESDRWAAEFVDSLRDAPQIAPEASANGQTRQGHLPPDGTREDVLARTLASFMYATCIAALKAKGVEVPEHG